MFVLRLCPTTTPTISHAYRNHYIPWVLRHQLRHNRFPFLVRNLATLLLMWRSWKLSISLLRVRFSHHGLILRSLFYQLLPCRWRRQLWITPSPPRFHIYLVPIFDTVPFDPGPLGSSHQTMEINPPQCSYVFANNKGAQDHFGGCHNAIYMKFVATQDRDQVFTIANDEWQEYILFHLHAFNIY